MTNIIKVDILEETLASEMVALANRMLGESLENGIETATQFAKTLVNVEETSGLALAHFLHMVNSNWLEFDTDGETFPQWAVRATGRSLATIQRRVCSYELLLGDYIPKKYRGQISQFSVRMLAKTYGAFLKQVENNKGFYEYVTLDHEVSDKQWLAISQCRDENQVIDVVREITGKKPNSNRTAFRVSKGVIWYYRGKKDGVAIGTLNWRSKEPLVQEGIDELMRLAKIKEAEEH